EVTIFEESDRLGGMCNLIPDKRLNKSVLKSDIEFLLSLGNISIKNNQRVEDAESLLDDYDAVLVAAGLSKPFVLNIGGSEHTIDWITYLRNYKKMKLKGKNVAIIGGGAVDCAIVAKDSGAETVELFALEKLSELPLTKKEFEELIEYNIHISFRTRIKSVKKRKDGLLLETVKVFLKEDTKFHPSLVKDVRGTEQTRYGFDFIVQAVGARGAFNKVDKKGVFYAGDFINGPKTVVEAVASGKNAASRIDAFLRRERQPKIKKDFKSVYVLKGLIRTPVLLNTKFFEQDIV
ncbi:MAG: FAD-dependent oxidoreductase, partial [Deltaproteobacteria bacterium]|nr:FAD-dependent oxidoreductase [Deltaproteobacteria bacterium]